MSVTLGRNMVISEGTAYINGIIYTAEATGPTAQAFLVENGSFSFVGDGEIVKDCPRKVDLHGKCVIPGLIDSHCHAFAGVTQASASVLKIDPEVRPDELGAALLALQILAVSDSDLSEKLAEKRRKDAEKVLEKDRAAAERFNKNN